MNFCDTKQHSEEHITCTASELKAISKCEPNVELPRDKYITVQQNPKVITQKQVVYKKKIVHDPKLTYRCKEVKYPHVYYVPKKIQIPRIIHETKIIKEPKIECVPLITTEPRVICCTKEVIEPREVSQAMICQPKPQTIKIPEPKKYCCYYGSKTVCAKKPGPSCSCTMKQC